MNKRMPVIKFRDFQSMLEARGFSLKEKTGTHFIYVDGKGYQVVLPYSGKEVKPIMAKVILDRIKRGNLVKYQTSGVTRTKGGI